MTNLSIIIPVLNEITILEESLLALKESLKSLGIPFEVIIADGGSSDGTIESAKEITQKFEWKFVSEKLEKPSVGKTIFLGLELVTYDYVLVLPIDCRIDNFEGLEKMESDYGGFEKSYNPSSFLLNIYAFLQNQIRTRLLKNIVWTNAIFAKKEYWKRDDIFVKDGFMEDVILSDNFKREALKFELLKEKVVVSSRLYFTKMPVFRIMINGLIMFLFRAGIKDANFLKKIYQLFKS